MERVKKMNNEKIKGSSYLQKTKFGLLSVLQGNFAS